MNGPEEHTIPPSPWVEVAAALPQTLRDRPISRHIAFDWSLVLKARGIPHRTQPVNDQWIILVPEASLQQAVQEILAYDRENPPQIHLPTLTSLPPAKGGVSAALVMAALALFHAVTTMPLPQLGIYPQDWLSAGAADSTKILSGEWWRAATALTLHADAAHAIGNAVIGGIFMACLCRGAGSGTGWFLFVIAGVAGNLVNAWMRGPGHLVIGASTAVFAAVGALAALTFARGGKHGLRRSFAPVVAGLALLGMLGTGGERTDLGAHLFGFACGLGAGLPVGRIFRKREAPTMLDALAGTLAGAIVLYAWWRAFT